MNLRGFLLELINDPERHGYEGLLVAWDLCCERERWDVAILIAWVTTNHEKICQLQYAVDASMRKLQTQIEGALYGYTGEKPPEWVLPYPPTTIILRWAWYTASGCAGGLGNGMRNDILDAIRDAARELQEAGGRPTVIMLGTEAHRMLMRQMGIIARNGVWGAHSKEFFMGLPVEKNRYLAPHEIVLLPNEQMSHTADAAYYAKLAADLVCREPGRNARMTFEDDTPAGRVRMVGEMVEEGLLGLDQAAELLRMPRMPRPEDDEE